MSKAIVFLMLLGSFLTANAQGTPDDIDGDGVPNSIDLDDDNDGILDTVENVINYIQLNGFTAYYPAVIPSSGLVTGNRLIKVNALTYLGSSYDAVLEFTDVQPGSGRVRLIGGGDIALQDIYAYQNPYFAYTIKFVPTGTATPTGPITGAVINNVAITIADIDGNGNSSDMGDVAGYAFANNITGAPIVGANLVNQGFTFGTSGIGGPGPAFDYYRPFQLTATNGAPNTTILADPLYMVTTYQDVYSSSEFIYGATGTETSEIGERRSQIFVRLGNINGVDTDGDGIINQYDLDSDNDGCSDSNEYYYDSNLAGPGQQYGQTGGNVAPVDVNGLVIGASYSGYYALAITVNGVSAFTSPVNQVINVGANTSFSVTPTGATGITTFVWQVSTNGGLTWTDVINGGVYSGANTTTLTLTGVPYSMNNYQFRLKVTDSDYVCGDSFSAPATLTFLNAAPDAVDDNLSANPLLEDGPNGTVNVIANDTDPDGNPTAPVNGAGQFTVDLDASTPGIQTTVTTPEGVWTLDPATGIVTFNPADNYFGTATLVYTLCDPSGACDSATITFVVNPVNDPPVAVDDTITTPYFTSVTIPVASNDYDIDGTINVATIDLDPSTPGIQTTFTVPGEGTYTANSDGTVTFTPVEGFEGSTTPIGYVIQDNEGLISNIGTISIVVGPCSTDPNGDCDLDGLSNSEEINIGTDPNNPDTDGDGVLDGTEVADNTNPLDFCESIEEHATLPQSQEFMDADCDGDGLVNGQEIGNIIGQPFDSNGNGIPDYLEVNNYYLSNYEDDLEIFNGVSPSSDDIKNNVFTIRNIEMYPNNTLQIFNQWGVVVYDVSGYGTNNKYFRGVSEGRATVSTSSELPEGTYFYVLKYVNSSGKNKERSGYLYLTR
ncbi:T9SS type B sorting domain-containing protein [Flavobacterium capsici]|uniref:Gliding motility-associated C-terminal domain-containing protein n=1 Tax=Flavobacterium capsici TaxID=3075618 RepID=A0AA96F1J6_9FLAO|nr:MULTISPECIES: gliding motility-associated C-terminal domain-containing protein [unclassified Flavobacterium]WNM18428.1 gliding motility-associated C-terminal domain-containing protein [Flavobacterium sp. PMR2A8]WNM22479.1 gliding motility-associated C-terminal domain-containing protein [Flavobacterium sp. PMTSA4]